MHFPNTLTPAVAIRVTITIDEAVVEIITPADLEEVAIDQVEDLVAAMTQTAADSIAREVRRAAAASPAKSPTTDRP